MKYREIKLKEEIQVALEALGFKEMTPVQEMGIPELLKKHNVMMKAPTGTGKTHAFLLPILENIDPTKKNVQAIIMAPTRELATQISLVARQCIKYMESDISIGLLIGGKDRGRLIETMSQTQPHIIIGTPGRLEDIIVKEKKVDIRYIQYVVLDETDMIVENGFLESIDAILTMLPEKITFAVCSATISQEIQQFLKKYVRNVKFIDVKKSKLANDKIEHLLLSVRENKRLEKLYEITEILDPYMALIFANTKKKVIEIFEFLQSKGMKVGMIHGDMQARERKQMLKRMQLLEFQYIVASDIAARGIDIDGVSHIINYEIPSLDSLAFYFHRAGRTGRMNYAGTIISLYEKEDLNRIGKLIKQGIDFQEIKLIDGEIVRTGKIKEKEAKALDAGVLSASQKAKRSANRTNKVKPGYKRKIKWAVTEAVTKEKRRQAKTKKKAQQRSAKK